MSLSHQEITYTNRQFLKDVWRFIRPYKARFYVATILRFASDVTGLYPAYALAAIVSFFASWQPGEALTFAWQILLIWIGAHVVYNVGHHYGKYLGYSIGEGAGIDAVRVGMVHLAGLDSHWHEAEASGNKMKRILRGRDALIKMLRIWISNIIQIFVDFTGTLLVMIYAGAEMGIIFGILIVVYTLIALVLNKKTGPAVHRAGVEEEQVHGRMYDIVGNIRTVRVLDISRNLLEKMNGGLRRLYGAIKERIFWFRLQGASLSTWYGLYKIGVFAFIVYGIGKGQYEVGFLVLFNGYSVRVRESAQELAEVSQEYVTAKNDMMRLMQTLNAPLRPGLSAPHAFPAKWRELSVKNLGFSYDANAPVLKGVSFTVKRGERIGIVGSSGAGKSTIFKLLLKEYEQFNGSITIDGVSIQQINEQSYFDRVAVVLQDTDVFNLSLKENIVVARPQRGSDGDLFKHATEVSYVSDFVGKLPNGYETVIGERGFKLSGGERQRVGIARAIFKQPDILLLDEATSHLDLESEQKIRDSLQTVFQNMTAIVIAHRLTTIKQMDRILVLENGKIVEEGTFAALHKKKGRFYDLWEKQRL